MRKITSMLSAMVLAAALSACSSSGSDGPPQLGSVECTNNGQKQFVLDAMRDVYFWNTSLPASVDLNAHATPEALLEFLIGFSPISGVTGQPIDRFSFINSATADQQFFGEGKFEGFGFSWRYEAVNDVRFTRVFTDGPAGRAGFARGQRIIALNGRTIADIDANEGVSAMFDLSPLEFTIRRLNNTQFTVNLTKDIVTINPLPQWRVINTVGGPVGYIEFATFISTADPVFNTIFNQFRLAGVNDLIIDLRYNGGGLVNTAELLADYLGGDVAGGLIFSKTLFNSNNSGYNSVRRFQQLAESLNLSRLVIVATRGTASASELLTNGMEPHVEVVIVGDTTYGKPVGQVGIEFCEKILRPTSFETVNSLDVGGYFEGLPADCPAADDVAIPVGADNDPNVAAALTYFATGACPAISFQAKTSRPPDDRPAVDLRGPAHREFAGAY